MPKPTDQELENRFLYHAPGPDAVKLHAIVSEETLRLAKLFRDILPEGRELAQVLTDLELARMHANQGIAMTQPLAGR